MSIEEFSALLRFGALSFFVSKESFDDRVARWLLKRYFKHPLNHEEIDALMHIGYSVAQDDWLKAMRYREASYEETKAIIDKMPWHMLRRFPFELPKPFLIMLFAYRNPQKIVAYCRDYALPEDYEKDLIENYRLSLKSPDNKMQYTYFGGSSVNGWAKALEEYLGGFNGERMTTKEAQLRLLDLGSGEIIKKLILRCNIARNPLHEDVIWRLIAEGYVDMVRLMLRESYIVAQPLMVDLMEKRMPQVLPLYYIAQYRRKVYLSEKDKYIMPSSLMFQNNEKWIIKRHIHTPADDMDDFVLTCVKPRIGTFSPSMCAYLAYYFPELADDLLKGLTVRKE